MSTSHNWTIDEWFRCVAASATPRERFAALGWLTSRMAGDFQRRARARVTLAGRNNHNAAAVAPSELKPGRVVSDETSRPIRTSPAYRGAAARDHVRKNAPAEPDDSVEGYWPREQLLEMDRRFTERLERAIAAGDEHPAK